ncbi:zinc-binding dehydrogenase [Leucobacter sp. Z1108]|uniref:zinc-binding dehydrogenase n=1 Tax=Leucobacter sp. Z1108 TaxID=3439066 RepID=UPI003F332FC2
MVTSPAPVAIVGMAGEKRASDYTEPTDPPTGPALTRARPHATAMLFMKSGRPHEPVAVPQVLLGSGELLVEVEFATVCSSDIHTALGHRVEPAPAVLGHEAVGRVSAIGGVVPAIDGVPLVPGDRVVWSVVAQCGTCDRCLRGIPQACRTLRKYGHERIGQGWELTGGFATHVHLREGTTVIRVDEGIPAAVLAPAGCGISTAWAALAAAERTVSLRGATVLVTGGGLIGLSAAAMARERGATVILAEIDEERRTLAHSFGAVVTFDPLAGSTARDLLASSGLEGREIDVVIEASGSPLAVAAGIDAVGPGGVVVLVGSVFPTDPVALVPERLVRSQVTVTGVHNYAPEHLRGALEFLASNWRTYPFEQLVGRVYPLIELDAALDRAALRREVRVGVTPAALRQR